MTPLVITCETARACQALSGPPIETVALGLIGIAIVAVVVQLLV